ncbi:MAG TPA: DUF3822 family protein [Bacteroidaceae bacterium]|nr:DUF3822 family protein [Bacteroidaceae bacterium]
MGSKKNMELYTLSIRIGADGFCFSLYNSIDKSYKGFMEYSVDENLTLDLNFSKAFNSLPFLKENYKEINIIFSDSEYTTVPDSFFCSDTAKDFLKYNLPSFENNTQLLTNHIPKFGFYLLSHSDKTLYFNLKEKFPSAIFHCRIAPIALYLSNLCTIDNIGRMYILQKESSIDLLCCRNGKLIFLNSFFGIDYNDFLYYIIGVWKSSGFSKKNDLLFLIKEKCSDNRFITKLNEFIENISEFRIENQINYLKEENPEGFEPNMDFASVPSEILAVTLCE